MDVLCRCCAGLDVHKKTISVCIRRCNADGTVTEEFRVFGTVTQELLSLLEWLLRESVTDVAMESTGVFWKPVFNVLEGHVKVMLCNARHVKNVPGRKTDTKDCQWLAQLLQCGLLRASFVPPRPLRELRDLTRTRVSLQNDKTRVANRILKVLEDANIKLRSVVSDILGKSSRAILQALAHGEPEPEALTHLALGRLKRKKAQLQAACTGKINEHHRFMLRLLLTQLRDLEALLERVEVQIDRTLNSPALNPEVAVVPASAAPNTQSEQRKAPALAPLGFTAAAKLLVEMWGVDEQAARAILAEIGTNMRLFPTEQHLASWAGICPGSNESAGKRGSSATRKGNRWLRRILVQAAWAATHAKESYFSVKYHRLAKRRGKQRALIAIAHSLLTSIYHMLRDHVEYHDLGTTHFDDLHRERTRRNLVKRLEALGYTVTLTPRARLAS